MPIVGRKGIADSGMRIRLARTLVALVVSVISVVVARHYDLSPLMAALSGGAVLLIVFFILERRCGNSKS